jgi:hypothetical protein
MADKKINLDKLHNALLYLKMGELKRVCERLGVDFTSKKGMLIERITTFVQTGKKVTAPIMPEKSKAKRGISYPLAPSTLILSGAYVNDLETRNFFKKLIGDHFHFTAYGIDWLNERWMGGNPPTYAEFAEFWQAERLQRKKKKPEPKEEWAYINFLQDYFAVYPHAPQREAMQAWKQKQKENVQLVWQILGFE